MEIIKITIEIILILMGFYFIFFKSYFQKKGENLATKEDIGKITNEIEKVKNEFSFQNQRKSDLFFETKKCLMGFYESYFIWTEDRMRFGDVIITHSNNKYFIRETINVLKKAQKEVLNNYFKIAIYIDDKKFTTQVSTTFNEILKLHSQIINFLNQLEEAAINHEKLIIKSKEINHKVEVISLKNEFEELSKKRDLAFKYFEDELSGMNDIIVKNSKIIFPLFKNKIYEKYSIEIDFKE